MADCLKFPDTVEEFMEQYKVTDYKQVYTNGTELVPIFRMKQWFERQPSADVAQVVHGKWIDYDDTEKFTARCSICGNITDTRFSMNYCSNCGAKMDGEEKRHETDRSNR